MFQNHNGNVACGADASGTRCWGAKITHQFPALQPDTQVFYHYGSPILSFLDSRGAHYVAFNLTQLSPWVMPTYQNPVRFDYQKGKACALDDSGIACSAGSKPMFVPGKFRY